MTRTGFRKNALAMTAAVIGLSAIAMSARANAQEITSSTDCTAYTDQRINAGENVGIGTNALCEIQKGKILQQKGVEIRVREQAADQTLKASQDATKCIENVAKEIQSAKARGPLTPDMKIQFKTRIERCDRVS